MDSDGEGSRGGLTPVAGAVTETLRSAMSRERGAL